jgi:predicted ATP-dependent Lon-type protease
MTQEQKDYLKEMVKFRNLNPFDNEDYDNRQLKELREFALEDIKRYKEFKKRIEEKKIEAKKTEELLKAIDSIPSSE